MLDATGGAGVDVVLDMVAGEYIGRNLKCLADDGRIVIIALLGGAHANVDCNQVLRRRLTITGSTLRPRPVEFKGEIARALRERVWPLLENGTLKPVVHATLPLEQAAAGPCHDGSRGKHRQDHPDRIAPAGRRARRIARCARIFLPW
ncbi:zinc-binding dehydrogenase [Bordetella pertussis]|nr:zinc-binding dehydrogenase [Bordetella pertussis]